MKILDNNLFDGKAYFLINILKYMKFRENRQWWYFSV